jgi:hypothetical protein
VPQLVKGGKYVFGWTVINKDYKVRIPDEAYVEYKFSETDKLILLSGSKSSGGFTILSPYTLVHSKLSNDIIRIAGYNKETNSFAINRLEINKQGERVVSWTYLDHEKYIRLSPEILSSLHLNTGDRLLVGRGSGLGPAFIAEGTIFEEALRHKTLVEYY